MTIATDSPKLSVKGVWKVFGRGKLDTALEMSDAGSSRAEVQEQTGCTIGVRDVSFDVGHGETFVVMGLSGSGKSTLVRCLARLIEPTRGDVLLDGANLLEMNEAALREVRRTKMSMVFQHFGLFPHRRVIDNVAYGLEVQGIAKSIRRARAGEILETVGLGAWATHYPQQLSGGMQQRVGLARALALDPEVLFFDEPFSALDPLIRRDMQDELIGLQSTLARTIIFITHDFDEALRLGDRIAIMKDGSFDQIGTPEEIVGNPTTDYVREFTNDVSKAKVLGVHAVMREPNGAAPTRSVASTTKIEDVVPMLLVDNAPVGVLDADGETVGIITAADIADVLGTSA